MFLDRGAIGRDPARREIPIRLRRILLTVISVVALALGASAASNSTTAVSITDPSGDAGAAPDITRVTVADDIAGSFTFSVDLATMPDLQPDGFLVVFIDADRDPDTGRNGAEYYVAASPRGLDLARWNGTAWGLVEGANLQLRLTGTGVSFVLPQAFIAASRFDVWAGATRDSSNAVDDAPDDGVLSFPPRIARFLVAQAILFPRAGGILDARRIQAQLSTGDFVRTPMTCRLTYLRKALKPLAGGCRWRIAKTLKRKRLTLRITASYNGDAVTTSVFVTPR